MSSEWIYLIILIPCVAMSLIVTLCVHWKKRKRRWDWTITLVATFLSVILALGGALWLYNHQTDEDDQNEKYELTKLLAFEMSSINNHLTEADLVPVKFNGDVQHIVITYIQPISFERIAQSGLFNPKQTYYILETARAIRLYNLNIEHFLNVISCSPPDNPYVQDKIEWSISNCEKMRKNLIIRTGTQVAMAMFGIDYLKDISKTIEEAENLKEEK